MSERRSRRRGGRPPTGASRYRSGWRRFLPENPWTVFWTGLILPIIAALVIVGVPAIIRALGSGADLQAFSPVVSNPSEETGDLVKARDGEEVFEISEKSKTRVEIRLQNTGNRRSVLTAARFTVRNLKVTPPPDCVSLGSVPVSGSYDVVLPLDHARGKTVEVPINQQLGPDATDRFVFRVGQYPRSDEIQTFVYQLDIGVLHDRRAKPTAVGRVLVALPGSPTRQDLSAFEGCGRPIFDQLREASTLTGVRGPEFDRVLNSLPRE